MRRPFASGSIPPTAIPRHQSAGQRVTKTWSGYCQDPGPKSKAEKADDRNVIHEFLDLPFGLEEIGPILGVIPRKPRGLPARARAGKENRPLSNFDDFALFDGLRVQFRFRTCRAIDCERSIFVESGPRETRTQDAGSRPILSVVLSLSLFTKPERLGLRLLANCPPPIAGIVLEFAMHSFELSQTDGCSPIGRMFFFGILYLIHPATELVFPWPVHGGDAATGRRHRHQLDDEPGAFNHFSDNLVPEPPWQSLRQEWPSFGYFPRTLHQDALLHRGCVRQGARRCHPRPGRKTGAFHDTLSGDQAFSQVPFTSNFFKKWKHRR